ncbi:peptide deformylase [Companilactobacillus sp. RD055328]|uniref:peptide deformylase n=1 Tax=Companilactobacillus sp. RD055328 TaxID=2916634 RepID=UPI001FC88CA0|nr:peptide deformylase [Companilactobacillus sp. RD055328]GKQ43327.1 peptide deformylase [Companilactobacillus sp. RD055328]
MIKDINRNVLQLNQKSKPATPADISVGQDLRDTLKEHEDHCVGMAANMIGINKRIIIVDMGIMSVVMYNPTISNKQKPFETDEGCLSLDGQRPTTRYEEITVTFFDDKFNVHNQKFNGFTAQIIQHEVDHCDGIII